MTSVAEFETCLKDVVHGKRLSASKMTKMTEVAMQCMENDTQLVSILYRTHKTLSRSEKVSGLYAFDALARAARSYANKHQLVGDVMAEKGNCASFLLKMESVLDGLFKDMVSSGTPESKEKAKKILDIWVKANTFPPAVLSRLSEVVVGNGKEPDTASTGIAVTVAHSQTPPTHTLVTTPPVQVHAPTAPTPPAAPTEDMQATLLALLSQAASAIGVNPSQTTTNTTSAPVPAQPQLDPNQLALLQHLASAAQTASQGPPPATSTFGQPLPPPASAPGFPSDLRAGPSHVPQYRDERYDSPREPRFDAPSRGRDRNDDYDDRRDHRSNGFRGEPRGRGRGRWDDRERDRFDRNGPRDFRGNGFGRGSRSRSRSPPPRSRYGARRDVKPYSPPRRPSIQEFAQKEPAPTRAVAPAPGKDEFGRDIRPSSVERDEEGDRESSTAKSTATAPAPTAEIKSPSREATPPVPSAPATVTPSASAATEAVAERGLDTFDYTTFDFTAPSSWEALGAAWNVTNGYAPSQEELMQFVVSGFGMAAAGPAVGGNQMAATPWDQQGFTGGSSGGGTWGGGEAGRGRGRGRGAGFVRGGRGRGINAGGYGNFRDGRGYEDGGYGADTDAVVLGNTTLGNGDALAPAAQNISTGNGSTEDQASVGSGGRMQRVGDRWVFVRQEGGGISS